MLVVCLYLIKDGGGREKGEKVVKVAHLKDEGTGRREGSSWSKASAIGFDLDRTEKVGRDQLVMHV
jgi:hypothetical protein